MVTRSGRGKGERSIYSAGFLRVRENRSIAYCARVCRVYALPMTQGQSLNGFRFAALARGESLQSPDVCACCGRDGLKKTVKLINPAGRAVWFGTGCAARAMGVKPLVVRDAARSAEMTAADIERRERATEERAEDMRWQAFLDEVAPSAAVSWDGRPNRFEQIDRLGGYAAARAAYLARGAS